MTPTDLQKLSRDAAGCLPKDAFSPDNVRWKIALDKRDGSYINGWLHESTEACTEIMVRVLWPDHKWWGMHRRSDYKGSDCMITSLSFGGDVLDVGDDPMLAFRVAVLRALVALKGKL